MARFTSLFIVLFAFIGCGTNSGTNTHSLVGSGLFPPAVTFLEPQTAPVDSVAFSMTIVGNNFGPDAIVFWNGIPAHTTPVNSQQLIADITVEDLQIAGFVPVYVRTQGQNSNTVNFDVLIR
jgi:hypothetical protein